MITIAPWLDKHHLDNIAIINKGTNQVIQFDFAPLSAQRSVDIFIEHERRNGRDTEYYFKDIQEIPEIAQFYKQTIRGKRDTPIRSNFR